MMMISKYDFIRNPNPHRHKFESADVPSWLFVARRSLAYFTQMDGAVITIVCKVIINSRTQLSHTSCCV